jgi:ABC-2 type transport system ATP-binding protein
MSTHQMNQVEELCDRILLIDHGQRLLYGTLQGIQNQFASKDILITPLSGFPENIPGVVNIKKLNGRYQLMLEENTEPNRILKDLVNQGVELMEFEIAVPPLNEIFIQVVQRQEEDHA